MADVDKLARLLSDVRQLGSAGLVYFTTTPLGRPGDKITVRGGSLTADRGSFLLNCVAGDADTWDLFQNASKMWERGIRTDDLNGVVRSVGRRGAFFYTVVKTLPGDGGEVVVSVGPLETLSKSDTSAPARGSPPSTPMATASADGGGGGGYARIVVFALVAIGVGVWIWRRRAPVPGIVFNRRVLLGTGPSSVKHMTRRKQR